jgi:hypothetical protein
MSILILRSSASVGASSWQDVTVGYSDMPAELGGTDGRKVRLRIDSSGTDWGTDLHTGASATRVAGGAFDSTDCIRIVPPSADQGHAAIMRFLDLSNGGAKTSYQTNLGFCIKYGSRYWDLGDTDKLTGVLASQTVGGTENASASRCGVFDAYNDEGGGDLRRIWSVTATTLASYTQPPVTGGTYDINGSGSFVSTEGTVNNDDTVRARGTSSGSFSTTVNVVVTIGGVSDTFSITTLAEPPSTNATPDSMQTFRWTFRL